jgi:hypothetical protein
MAGMPLNCRTVSAIPSSPGAFCRLLIARGAFLTLRENWQY